MRCLIENGNIAEIYRQPKQLTLSGVTYPPVIFRTWSDDEFNAIGIVRFSEVTPDQRYYSFSSDQYTDSVNSTTAIRTYIPVAKDISELKTKMKEAVKSIASNRLSETDWMVTRAVEGGTAVPEAVTAYRAAVRAASNTKEAEIDALDSLDAIKAYEAKPYVEVRKVKHTSEEGVETYGPETEESNREISMVTGGWPVDPLAEVDPAFVSLTAV